MKLGQLLTESTTMRTELADAIKMALEDAKTEITSRHDQLDFKLSRLNQSSDGFIKNYTDGFELVSDLYIGFNGGDQIPSGLEKWYENNMEAIRDEYEDVKDDYESFDDYESNIEGTSISIDLDVVYYNEADAENSRKGDIRTEKITVVTSINGEYGKVIEDNLEHHEFAVNLDDMNVVIANLEKTIKDAISIFTFDYV